MSTHDVIAADPTRIFQMRCSQERDYGVHLFADPEAADARLAQLFAGRKTLVVATKTVWSLYGWRIAALRPTNGTPPPVLVLDVDEATKSIENVLRICEACHEHELGRTDAIIALGGGVCLDLVTVAATLVRRGLAYVCVPTTLVGQIDAGVGVKGAVNFMGSKSYLGSFRPPEVVIVEPTFLSTAPERTLRDGLAEAVKIALTSDAVLFGLLEQEGVALARERFATTPWTQHAQEVLRRCIVAMLHELAPNLFEDRTYRRKVDFGHTFSGVLEAQSGYELSHGHAVAIDMALSASLAVSLGRLDESVFARIITVLRSFGLPTTSPLATVDACHEALHSASLHRGGHANLVIPTGVGACDFIADARVLTDALLCEALARVAG